MIAKDESDRALAHAPKDARRRPANAPSARRSEAGAFGPALGALVLAPRCLPRLDFDWDSFPSPERQRQCGGRRYMARTAIVTRQRMSAPWFAAAAIAAAHVFLRAAAFAHRKSRLGTAPESSRLPRMRALQRAQRRQGAWRHSDNSAPSTPSTINPLSRENFLR